MKRLLLILALLPLAACGPQEYTWNQRMTVTVETPDGIVEGSSVIEVNATYCPGGCGLAGDIEVSYGHRGEVVAVEILPGQWLFTLFGREAERMYRASPDQFGGIPLHDRGAWLAATPRQAQTIELTGARLPRLVMFGDVNDPRSAVEVDPNDLAATFGEGVRLIEVTLEITQAPPAVGSIRSILPSLGEFPENRLVDQVDPFNPSFPQSLETGFFIRR
jgi:hypothetical protein